MTRLSLDLSLSRQTLPALSAIGLFWGAFAAMIPDIKAGLGMGDAAFGFAMLAAAVGAVAAMWMAPVADKVLGRATQPLAALASVLSFVMVGAAGSVPVFTAAVLCAGAATGLLDIATNLRIASVEARANRSLMNLNHAGYSVIYGICAAAVALPREVGVAPVWVFVGVGVIVTAMSVTMWMPAGDADDEGTGSRFWSGFNTVAVLAGIVTLVGFLAENATEGWSALHVERTLGGRAAEGALGPAVLGFTMGAGRFMGHLLTIRGAEMRVIGVAAVLSATGSLVAAGAHAPWLAYVGFGILGLGVSVTAPLALSLAGRLAPPGRRAITVSRCALLGFLGFFIGPPLMGWMSAAVGLRAAYVGIALLLLAMPLVLVPLRVAGLKASRP
ncbi:MFS transporter [Anianabacter salinae]|uniref:MFS transporter n=1 Tax=Anianabacter salinae TaxID=2851023 RepID=UPI00225E5A71|nr:MFS transporter [Anianabacter salinae]MBV0912747.1 MFS transporter [Anianabacter salinae]